MDPACAPLGRGGAVGQGFPDALGPLHASEANLFLRCPRKWQLAYGLRRVPTKDAEALTRGNAVHAWLAAWWMGQPTELPEDPVARACCIGYGAYYQGPNLANVRSEVKWTANVGGIDCAGTFDCVATAPDADGSADQERLIVVEHKTTSQDIAPGSMYWRSVVTTDLQVSMYRAAMPGAKVLYDVVRKPALRLGKSESSGAYLARMVDAMSEDPPKYFQRAYVVRLQAEDDEFARDVVGIDRLRRGGVYPRSHVSCMAYGHRCEYFDHCWNGEDLMGPSYKANEHGILKIQEAR